MAKNSKNEANGFETIEASLSKGEQFVEKYQKQISIVFLGIIVIISLYIAYNRWYKAPLEKEAAEQMYVAEQYFATDSFQIAINGDGQFPGFLSIVDSYGSTKAGNMARLYLGISYYQTQQYDLAIDYLSDFKSSDPVLKPLAYGNIGDSYNEKGELENAAKYYEKAASYDKNILTSPIYYMKAARSYEQIGKYNKALDIYKKIKAEYKKTDEGRQIDKYIVRAEMKLKSE